MTTIIHVELSFSQAVALERCVTGFLTTSPSAVIDNPDLYHGHVALRRAMVEAERNRRATVRAEDLDG